MFHLINCLENQSIPEKLLLFEKCTAKTQTGRMDYSNPKCTHIQYTGPAKLGKKASKGKAGNQITNGTPKDTKLV